MGWVRRERLDLKEAVQANREAGCGGSGPGGRESRSWKVLAVEVAGSEKDAAYAFMLWGLVGSLLLELPRLDKFLLCHRNLLHCSLLMARGSQVA